MKGLISNIFVSIDINLEILPSSRVIFKKTAILARNRL